MNESPARVARKVKARREGGPLQGDVVHLRSSRLVLLLLALTFSIAAAWIMLSSFIFVHGPEALIGAVIGAAIALIALVFFILPLQIRNLLSGTALLIRYGIQFSEEIPLYEIEEVERVEGFPGSHRIMGGGIRLGVEYSLVDRRFTVIRSKQGMVRIRLRNEIVINSWFIPRVVKEIVFDTLDGDKVIERVHKMRLLGVK